MKTAGRTAGCALLRRRGWLLLALLAAGTAGCARRPPVSRTPPPLPPPETAPAPAGAALEEGLASWYGVPFHGRRTASGEVYDMEQHTAAHRTLPFHTIVRVVNLKNGRSIDVRVNDRGPFVEGRVIDLSLAAARALEMVADGVVRVRLERVEGPHALSSYFTVQVGAFRERENALLLRQRLERRYQPVFLDQADTAVGMFFRIRVGRVPSEDAARRLAERLARDEQLQGIVLRLEE